MSENSPWTIKMEQQEFTDHLLKSTIKGYNLALDDVLKIKKEGCGVYIDELNGKDIYCGMEEFFCLHCREEISKIEGWKKK